MKGKYFLDEIDDIVYSTNSYELYNLYDKLFFKQPEEIHSPIEKPALDTEANRDAWKKALQQEKEKYDNGYKYISELIKIRVKVWKKGRWVKEVV